MSKIIIIHGDCRQHLSAYKNQVDLVLTDPPFSVSNQRNSSGASKKFSGYTSNKGSWDKEVPADEWVPLAVETLKPGGLFACFGVFGSLVPIFTELQRLGLTFQSHIIWHKSNPAPSIHRRMLTHANELVLLFSNGPRWYFDYPYSKTLNNGKQCHNVFTAPAVRKVLGVTVKPIAFCEQLVRLFCPEGGMVLDPFFGSGAIPEAAFNCNRSFIAIEKRKDCVDYLVRKGLQISLL